MARSSTRAQCESTFSTTYLSHRIQFDQLDFKNISVDIKNRWHTYENPNKVVNFIYTFDLTMPPLTPENIYIKIYYYISTIDFDPSGDIVFSQGRRQCHKLGVKMANSNILNRQSRNKTQLSSVSQIEIFKTKCALRFIA